MRESEMMFIAEAIRRALADVKNDSALAAIGAEVVELCRKFPAYPRRDYGNAAA
jgi:glycine/serine hydroxymethyltransferase